MSNPKVTVLMPIYNGAPYLKQAIDSILAQTYTNFEFLMIDDASSDDSIPIIQTFKDERIKLVRHKNNLNLTNTLNEGLSLATGDYIARMDQDDVSLSTRLATQTAYLDENPEIGVVGSDVQIIDEDGQKDGVVNFPKSPNQIRWALCFYCPLAHPTVMMRRKLIQHLGRYTSELLGRNAQFGGEDYALWHQASQSTSLANLNIATVQLRKHDSNLTKIHHSKHRQNSVIISRAVMTQYLKHKPQSTVVESLIFDVHSHETRKKEVALLCDLYRGYLHNVNLNRQDGLVILTDLLSRLRNRVSYYNVKEMLQILSKIMIGKNSVILITNVIMRKIYFHLRFKLGIH